MTAGQLLWNRALPVVGAAVLCLQFGVWLPQQVRRNEAFDTDVYYAAAQHIAAGEQVYGRQQRVRTDEVPSGFFYPPTALAFVSPARYVSLTTWRYLVFGLAVLSMWALAGALVKLGTGQFDIWRTLSLGMLLAIFPPVGQSLNVGNLDMLVIAMTAWAFAVPRFTGLLIVLATAIKAYPAFAAFAWIMRRERPPRALWFQAALTAAACTAVALFGLDHRYWTEWRTLGVPALTEPVAHFGNWSLSMILIYPDIHAEVANTPRVARTILTLASSVAACLTAFLLRRRPVTFAAAAAIVAGTWFTAFCWWWRILPLLLIPAALWIREQKESSAAGATSSTPP